ncbi:hypothetical protein TcasGA2_TC030957 [Tribolium castaneum]|uniref:Uncharacterized protein n=1 Tax=Tribolium castaneum TaxID=7070 RepID=A0A139W8K5_TRICA|nr:hypothetical protein TcasGA2_TC030957 [Tribolium castaneum]
MFIFVRSTVGNTDGKHRRKDGFRVNFFRTFFADLKAPQSRFRITSLRFSRDMGTLVSTNYDLEKAKTQNSVQIAPTLTMTRFTASWKASFSGKFRNGSGESPEPGHLTSLRCHSLTMMKCLVHLPWT